jgi:hypothetical protein
MGAGEPGGSSGDRLGRRSWEGCGPFELLHNRELGATLSADRKTLATWGSYRARPTRTIRRLSRSSRCGMWGGPRRWCGSSKRKVRSGHPVALARWSWSPQDTMAPRSRFGLPPGRLYTAHRAARGGHADFLRTVNSSSPGRGRSLTLWGEDCEARQGVRRRDAPRSVVFRQGFCLGVQGRSSTSGRCQPAGLTPTAGHHHSVRAITFLPDGKTARR